MFRFSYAAKVGLIFLVTVFLFFMVLGQLGYQLPWMKSTKGYLINARFESAKGLKNGDDVQYNGVLVGEVMDLQQSQFGDVMVIIRIPSDTDRFHENAFFSITQSSIFGSYLVYISEQTGGVLQSQGKENPDVYQLIMPRGKTILGSSVYYHNAVVGEVTDIVQSSTDKLSDIVTIELSKGAKIELSRDQTFVPTQRRDLSVPVAGAFQSPEESIIARIDIYNRIEPGEEIIGRREPGPEDLIASANNLIDAASGAISNVSESLNTLVANINVALEGLATEITSSEEGTVKAELVSAITKLRDGLVDVEKLTNNLNNILLEAQPRIDGILTSVEGAAADIGDATSQVKTMISDPEIEQSLRNTVANIEKATEDVVATIAEIEGLIGDDKTQEDIKAILSGARETVETASVTLKEAQHTFQSFGDTNINGQFRVRYLTEPDHFASDFELTVTPSGRELFYRAMVEDIGDADDFSFQLGYRGNKGLGGRFGIKRGQVGAGFDYDPGDFFLRGDIYNPNDMHFDIYGGFAISKDFRFIIGFEDLYDQDLFHFGVATEF